MKQMFKGANNSRETALYQGITAQDTTIRLLTVAGLPPAPNIATIGTDDDAEVIYYGGVSGTSLTGCVRGFGGTVAKDWLAETIVARCFTCYDHDTFVENILELQSDIRKYGVKFTGSASAGERLYDARGMVAGVSTDKEHRQNDFDNVMPWAGMRRCNTAVIEGERVPTVFEGEVGFDNVNKDVFVYVPLFFYYRSPDDREHVVSMQRVSGFRAPRKFRKKDGTLRDFVFLPAYTAGLVDGVPVSRSGHYPHITSTTGWMNLCKQKHSSGLDGDVWIEGMADDEIKNILLDIEFATRDHQTFMQGASSMRYTSDKVTTGGTDKFTVTPEIAMNYAVGQAIAIGTTDKGNQKADNATITGINTDTGEITFKPISGSVTVDAGNFISSRPWKSGACDNVKGSCGSPVNNTSGRFPCVYRGIENPYGNQYRFRWDFLKNDDQPYVLDDPSNYDGSLNGHYTALGYKVPTTNGYATEMGFDERFPHARVTSAIGGSSNTNFADYYYYSAGLRVLLVGGYVTNGCDAGARFCNVYYSPSIAYWSFGAALSPA